MSTSKCYIAYLITEQQTVSVLAIGFDLEYIMLKVDEFGVAKNMVELSIGHYIGKNNEQVKVKEVMEVSVKDAEFDATVLD